MAVHMNFPDQKQPVCEIVGHRGAGSSCVEGESSLPENSLAAFTRAVQLGLKFVELDVWLTKDNQVVVIHGGGTTREGYIKKTAISQVSSASLDHSQKNLQDQQGIVFAQANFDAPKVTESGTSVAACSEAPSPDSASACTSFKSTSSVSLKEPHQPSSNEDTTPVAQPDGASDRIELLDYGALQNASLLPLLRRPWGEYVKSQVSDFKSKEQDQEAERQAIISPRRNSVQAITGGNVRLEEEETDSNGKATGGLRALINIPSWRLSAGASESRPTRRLTKGQAPRSDNEGVCKALESSSDDKCFENEAPWLISAVETLTQEPLTVKQRYLLTPKEQKTAATDAYERDAVPFTAEHSPPEVLPLLETVLRHFQGKLSFIVEMKGTRPELGQRVLEIAQRYPGTVDQISSFSWRSEDHVQLHTTRKDAERTEHSVTNIPLDLSTIPGDVADKWLSPASGPPSSMYLFPNGDVPVDLLAPLRNNTANIPIALLFGNRYRLPGVKDIVAYLKKYNSRWAHVPWHFLFEDSTDHANALKFQKKLLALPGARQVLEKLPTIAEVARLGLPVNARAQSELNGEVSFEPAVLVREVIQQELASLLYLTQKLHMLGYKVLAYGSNGQETEDMLSLYLKIGLDRLCPNNIAAASRALEKHLKDRSKKSYFNYMLHQKRSVDDAAVVSSTYNERPVSDHLREVSPTPAATSSPDLLGAS